MTKKKEKKALHDRASLKAALKALKVKRQEAVEAKDADRLKKIRRQYKKTNRLLCRASAAAAAAEPAAKGKPAAEDKPAAAAE